MMTFVAGLSLCLAAVQLPPVFSDGVVLQRDRKVPVWGCAAAGERVNVSFAGQRLSTRAAADGTWRVNLAPMGASSESRELKVNDIVVRDVLVGEVWLCSGQSNMNLSLFGSPRVTRHAEQAMDMGYLEGMISDMPMVRYFRQPCVWKTEETPYEGKPLTWARFVPGDGLYFSAIPFHYAKLLHEALKVPVGVINCSWGGASIRGFVPAEGYASVPSLVTYATTNINTTVKGPQNEPRACWNGMIYPLAPLACRGMLWYQGESDVGLREAYYDYLTALWNGWRLRFEQPELPIYVVQIAPHDYSFSGPDSPYATRCEILMAQAKFGREHGGYVATIDVGDARNIHCARKRIVALRLAALALHNQYGRSDIKIDQPVFESAVQTGDEVIVKMAGVKDWELYGEAPVHVELADASGALTKLAQEDLTFESGGVIRLKAHGLKATEVRYNWNWFWHGKLANELGYPVSPFKEAVVTQ